MIGALTPGKIITFYSYKGGTGRSMALANVAWILASNGKRVLAIDWDLEAPGLHRYFFPFLVDRRIVSSEGMIDFVFEYALAAMTPPEGGGNTEKDWYLPYTNILRYATSLEWTFPRGGRIDFIPAGRQVPSYSSRVNSFNWQDFYSRLGGAAFFEAVKERVRAEYDYILIDSRTGVSDTSGICTVQMPDILVVCFTLNHQSIEGAAAVAASAKSQRPDADLRIVPVATRIENAEKEKRDSRLRNARKTFSDLEVESPGRVQLPYVPYYAYEEILSTFGDDPEDSNTLLESIERLTERLTNGEVKQLVVSQELDQRSEVLAAYAGGRDWDKKNGASFKLQWLNWPVQLFVRWLTTAQPVLMGVFLVLVILLGAYAARGTLKLVRQEQKNAELAQRLSEAERNLQNSILASGRYQVGVITTDAVWKLSSTEQVLVNGRPMDFRMYLRRPSIQRQLVNYESVVAVGLASCEGGSNLETERAQRRAHQLLSWIEEADAIRRGEPTLHTLNLGRFIGPCTASSSESQRRVLLIGINENRRAALRDSLRAILKRDVNINIDDFTTFDLNPLY